MGVVELSQVRALRGPNIWGRRPALEVEALLSEEAVTPGAIAVAERRISAILAEVAPGSWVRSESRGEPLMQLFAQSVIHLMQAAGMEVSFWRVEPRSAPRQFTVVIEYCEEPVARRALDWAQELFKACFSGMPFDARSACQQLRILDEQVRLGPTTNAIVSAAARRGIPVRRLNQGSLVQLGWGARGRRILAAETDATSIIGENIAQDKQLCRNLLMSVGVPVPLGKPVKDAAEAWDIACELGLPVVVKPRYGNQGRGVAVNLSTREQVLEAYQQAAVEGGQVIVERFAPGADHRVLVVGGRVVAAARREPPQLMGDGVHTIAELVLALNEDPRRGEDHATALSKIPLDAIADTVLAAQGYTQASVPPLGTPVLLRHNANLSTGGSATDMTDRVHPEVAARAIDAALVIGLDIAGVDLICCDLGVPLEHQGGVVLEVNAAPGFRMHLAPSVGQPRPVGEAVIDLMFSHGENGRVPLVAVAGTNGKTTTTRLIAWLFRAAGTRVGMTCTDGCFLDDQCLDTGDCSGPQSARLVLLHPDVEAAVLETARGGILREGLGFDRCDIAVVTNIGAGDHLGLNGIHSVEQLAAVKRTIIENVAATGFAVLNAADPLTAAMASSCAGQVTFIALDPRHPVLATHRASGGRVVFTANGQIIATERGIDIPVVDLADAPLTLGGRARFQVENVLCAVAAAWAAGLSWSTIAEGLRSFGGDLKHVPGRFNILSQGGATIIVDYGHNTDAIRAIVDSITELPHRRRRVVFTAAGDRRDEDILIQGQLLGDCFDEVILYEDRCTRGRQDGETVALLRKGLSSGTRVSEIADLRGEFQAIDEALNRTQEGDLVLLQIDRVEAAIAHIQRRLALHGDSNPSIA